jgi:serine/threonine protein kinase
LWCNPERGAAYTLNKVVNYGGRSVVYKGIVNNEQVIVKKIKKKYNREIPFLVRLRNVPGVIQYKSYFFDDNFVYTVLTKIPNTMDLFDYITKCKGYLSEAVTKTILKQLINILINCKNKGILHNDIKETNILIDPLSKEITLIDFDASEDWVDNYTYDTHIGTWQYSCPEWHARKMYTADDMTSWSLGIMMYSVICGHLPFETPNQIIYNDLPSNAKHWMSRKPYDFLTQCLAKNNAERIKLTEMLSHQWFIDL